MQITATSDDSLWLTHCFTELTVELSDESPSEWAERRRYLPPSVTPSPGYFDWSVCPPMREIIDCLDPRSPVREVNILKGSQIGATTALLENAIGYYMDSVKSAPMMFTTADNNLAKIRMDSYIMPMIQQSDLMDCITSHDETSNRRTGKAGNKLEFTGGGWLLLIGTENPSAFRSVSSMVSLQDEIDTYKQSIGKDGNTQELIDSRTDSFRERRKVVRLSTPTIEGQSNIDAAYKDGDQRVCMLPCKRCGEYNKPSFNKVDKETGLVYGLTWDAEDGMFVQGSERYICKSCGHAHRHVDKQWMLDNHKWVPTATPIAPDIRSYHYPSLIAAMFYPWSAIIEKWHKAWDVANDRVRDVNRLQVFYNNELGRPFRVVTDKLKLGHVRRIRRSDYRRGEINNQFIRRVAGQELTVLTCAVDVHKDKLFVAVFGWAAGARGFLIDYLRLEGDTEQLSDEGTWGALHGLISDSEWTDEDGQRYKIKGTLVDAGYRGEQAIRFCGEFTGGVAPVRGRGGEKKFDARFSAEFQPYTTKLGTVGYMIDTDTYKDRIAASLRNRWDGTGEQPEFQLNAPVDIDDRELKELTVESKRPVEKNGVQVGFGWYRPSGSDNELWDLFVYNHAALDMLVSGYCLDILGEKVAHFTRFFEDCNQHKSYIEHN